MNLFFVLNSFNLLLIFSLYHDKINVIIYSFSSLLLLLKYKEITIWIIVIIIVINIIL
jgi:hypothetical protein